ncbi:MAG TPA: hypothetical protein VFV47_14030 [Hyphomicrobiaceae bacterium]|nr:hypothetical protein [Hyphomicrobiaceae bacterium]
MSARPAEERRGPGAGRALLVGAAILVSPFPAAAQGRLLEACSRGNLQVCSQLLNRPRLEPGRREAIQLHLAELEKLIVACTNGDDAACATLAARHPDLPPDITRREK